MEEYIGFLQWVLGVAGRMIVGSIFSLPGLFVALLIIFFIFGCQSPAYQAFEDRYPLDDLVAYAEAVRKNESGIYTAERRLAQDRANVRRYWGRTPG